MGCTPLETRTLWMDPIHFQNLIQHPIIQNTSENPSHTILINIRHLINHPHKYHFKKATIKILLSFSLSLFNLSLFLNLLCNTYLYPLSLHRWYKGKRFRGVWLTSYTIEMMMMGEVALLKNTMTKTMTTMSLRKRREENNVYVFLLTPPKSHDSTLNLT